MKRFSLLALLLAFSVSAKAQTYIYQDLGTTGYGDTFGTSGNFDSQVGYGLVAGQSQALLWKNSAASATVLPATGYTQTQANGIFNTWAVGSGVNSSNQTVGLLWQGVKEPINLNPSFATSSVINAFYTFGPFEMVGTAIQGGRQVAVRWSGPSAVLASNINPSSATSSQALASTDAGIAGSAVFSGVTHAYVWITDLNNGDLHPSGALRSEALGIDGFFLSTSSGPGAQVDITGDYTTGAGSVHACVWEYAYGSSTPPSMVDLHPSSGYTMTAATAMTASTTTLSLSTIVGYGTTTGGTTVALAWTNGGGPTDLSSYLPVGTTSSRATAMDLTYGTIIGTAVINGNNHAFLLMPTSAPTFLSPRQSLSTFIGVPYSYNVIARAVPSPTFSISSGQLPPGLSISPTTGVISGTPTQLGTYSGFISAANTISGVQKTLGQSFSIKVVAAPAFLQASVIGSLDPANGTGKHQALVLGNDGNFYGTSTTGGAGSNGAVFQMTPGGSQATIHAFGDGSIANDGAQPMGLTLYSDGSLYGTTFAGGAYGKGTIFHVSQGTTSLLSSFSGVASSPATSMALGSDGNLYGTTQGGSYTAFLSQPQGYFFSATPSGTLDYLATFNGFWPSFAPDAALTTSGSSEFGTAPDAILPSGVQVRGNVFLAGGQNSNILTLDPSGFSSVGCRPHAPATLMKDNNFYGIASAGGTASSDRTGRSSDPVTADVGGIGTIYKTGGSGGTQIDIHAFGDGTVANDGVNTADQGAPLILGDDGFLYGVTPAGGSANQGCFFQIGMSGGMTVLHSFGDGTVANDGQVPGPAFIKSKTESNTFYVMTEKGGANGNGAICRFSVGWAPTITNGGFGAGGGLFKVPIGATYSSTLGATGNPTPTFSVTTGSLPPGINLTTNGQISGTFTTTGTFVPIIVTCTNGVSPDQTSTGSFTVGPATPTPAGNVGTAYSFKLFRSSPQTYSVTAGALPPGVTLSPSAFALTGTPTTAGSYLGTITSTGSFGSVSQNFNITITSTYSAWAATHFTSAQLNDPTYSSATAIPQNDGVPNLLKFLYDMDPTQHISDADRAALPMAGLDTTSNPGTTYLTLTYHASPYLSGVTVAVQTSTDLQSWTTVTPDITKTLSTNPTTGDNTIEVEVNTNSAPHEYIRLNVTTQ